MSILDTYHRLTGEVKQHLLDLTTDGANRKDIVSALDEKVNTLAKTYRELYSKAWPFDLFLETIFEQGSDKNAAYRVIMLTGMMENQQLPSENMYLFRAIAYLIYGNTTEADRLIQEKGLQNIVARYPCFNATLQGNLDRIRVRCEELQKTTA